jgi:hypothetical protein
MKPGSADSLFDAHKPLYLRPLSPFRRPLSLILFRVVARYGYAPQAMSARTAHAWIVLPLTYWLIDPAVTP